MTSQPSAMFSKTGSDDFPVHLKCMITGPPKSGKTTLLGTVPNILVLDTEPHANNLQSIAHLDVPYKAIHSTDDLRQAQFILSQEGFRKQAAQGLGLPDIEAVAIDTLDTLQMIMKRERVAEQRRKFQRDDWGWMKEEMTALLQSFLSLPMHVFFVVHTKSENIGTEENPKTVILPGLEGSIARSIAGMVGYSLLAFRKEEPNPGGLGTFTKYWLRAEGDETYEYLGNRAAGKLPDIIEPDFKTLLNAALANRPQTQHQPIEVQFQTTGQNGNGASLTVQPPQQQNSNGAAPVTQATGQQQATGVPQPLPQDAQQAPAQQQPVAQNAGQPQEAPKAPDDAPVTAAALSHVKKVYDAIGQQMPEDKIKALNLGQARDLCRAWVAVQRDDAEGKGPEGQSAADVMMVYLQGMDLLSNAGAVQEQPQVTPDLHGTIDQVKAYVGDDLARANEAFEVERSGKNRVSLMQWLESKGASHGGVQTPVQTQPAQEQPAAQAPQEAPSSPDQGVTSDPAPADTSQEEQQVKLIEDKLGGQEIGTEITPDSKCQKCGNTIDDVDLAQIGLSRFGQVLCVGDYIAETKK